MYRQRGAGFYEIEKKAGPAERNRSILGPCASQATGAAAAEDMAYGSIQGIAAERAARGRRMTAVGVLDSNCKNFKLALAASTATSCFAARVLLHDIITCSWHARDKT